MGITLMNATEIVQASTPFLLMGKGIFVLFFGLIAVYIETRQSKGGWGPTLFGIVSITLVITAGLFLATVSDANNVITGIIGLLGTIVGYLLGRFIDDSRRKGVDEILATRYVKGELTREQYVQMKEDLKKV